MNPVWFQRFGDIPGVRYETPAGLDMSRLPGHGKRPTVHEFAGLEPSLWWGNTSASPAHERAFTDHRSTPTGQLLDGLAKTLELPGEPADYHFAIQGTAELLGPRRREGPRIFAELERLCWLDLDLIQAVPAAVSFEHDGEQRFFAVLAFGLLLRLYLREGFLADALRVAEVAERFNAGDIPGVLEARARAAALAAEDAVARP